MTKQKYLRRVLTAIREGRELCKRYQEKAGTPPCFLSKLDKLERATQRVLDGCFSEPIGRPNWNYTYTGPQLIDLTRQDAAGQTNPSFPWKLATTF